MKKKSVVDLIRYHAEGNENAFRDEAYAIANEFDLSGDYQLAEYIMALMSDANVMLPQQSEPKCAFLNKLNIESTPLFLPELVSNELIGIANAINKKAEVNKFIFAGAPGTGKTEAVKQLGRILERDVYGVVFSSLIDSKLGQTQKNIESLFEEINSFARLDKSIFMFDEIDALALDRVNSNDLREMGRVVSTLLQSLDALNKQAIIIATTNLYNMLDKALTRRFDFKLDFDCYNRNDLIEIADNFYDIYMKDEEHLEKNKRLFRKIIALFEKIPMPGELKNLIKTSIVFSNDKRDYFKRLYRGVTNSQIQENNIEDLRKQGFTVREIEILTGVSKSTVSRGLKEE